MWVQYANDQADLLKNNDFWTDDARDNETCSAVCRMSAKWW